LIVETGKKEITVEMGDVTPYINKNNDTVA